MRSGDGNILTLWSKLCLSQWLLLYIMTGVAHVYKLYKKSFSQPVIVCSLLSNRSTYSIY